MNSLRRMVQDAVSEVQAAERERARQYEQLSKLCGPFDHSEMDDVAFAKYGLEKLGHDVPDDEDDAPVALRAVLAEKAKSKNATGGMDAAPVGTGLMARYLAGQS